MKKLVKIGGWIVFVAAIGVVLGFAKSRHKEIPCDVPSVVIHHDSGFDFVTEEMVLERLRNIGYNFTGEHLCEVDLPRIEQEIVKIAGVDRVESFVYLNGDLVIDVKQRRPIVRLINDSGTSFYVDDEGNSMPLSDQCHAKVPVITGCFNEPTNINAIEAESLDSNSQITLLDEMFRVASCIDENDFWKNQIVQIYVNCDKEFELIPRVGNQRILFGPARKVKDKFKKLEIFYKNGIRPEQLNLYDTLTVKYKGQIVCSKK
jgi:cell division protein FtsQ